MRIFKAGVLIAAVLCATVSGVHPSMAGKTKSYESAVAAYQEGITAIQKGQVDLAILALEYAADNEILAAQLQLARIYAEGVLLPKDTSKAFQYYQDLADRLAEANPYNEIGEIAAEAFVAIAEYYKNGLPELLLSPNYRKAAGLYFYAASYFGDAEAQYRLAGMYLEGLGREQDAKMAVRWLLTAAKQYHPRALALLGIMLWKGQDIRQDRARGLALLFLSTEVVATADRKRITSTYQDAWVKATKAEIQRAGRIVQQWRREIGKSKGKILPWGESEVAVAKDDKPAKGQSKTEAASKSARRDVSPQDKKKEASEGSATLATKDGLSGGKSGPTSHEPDRNFGFTAPGDTSGPPKKGTTFSDDGNGNVFGNDSGTQFMGNGTLPVGATDIR